MRLRTVLALAILAGLTELNGADWPCFRGPTHQGFSPESNPPMHWGMESNILWKAEVPGDGWSSPIVCGDNVFITTAVNDGKELRLIRFDAESGRQVWNKKVFDQVLYRKEPKNSYATPTPVADSERVYTVSFNGEFAALDMNGDIVWRNDEFDYFSRHGIAASLVLHDGLLMFPFDESSTGEDKRLGWQKPWDKSFIIALDKNTGEVRWKAKRGLSRIAHVTPNILENERTTQLVSAAGDVVQGFNIRNGERLWTVESTGEGVVPSVVIGDNLVYTASGFGAPRIRGIQPGTPQNPESARVVWAQRSNVPMIPSFVYSSPYLFTLNEAGNLMCLEEDTGRIVREQRMRGHYYASPVLVDGMIYLLSEEGITTIITATPESKVLAENRLDGRYYASMAVSDGRLYLRSEDYLYCIDETE
ncbi:MAG: PQQ-binding-like beta-propeller repeat protein [Verrucomicrobia bacterium]|nr:PQQ-binding-like beta-propeller repeat protein [Verrucomicrobiota bacterium]MCF7708854.1 PQQ-binding-like beta-propeller repeat protein [Verrucomicrobiota bacterium]